MNPNAAPFRNKTLPRENTYLLGTLLENPLLACERYAKEFSKVAALARTIEVCELNEVDRTQLLTTLEEIASDAAVTAGLDVNLFQGLLAGELLARRSSRKSDQRLDVIVAPSTNTRH